MKYTRYIQGAARYLEERHVGLDPGKNGGLVEELPGWVGRSAHQAVRTLLLGVLNQAAHLHHITYSMRNCREFKENLRKGEHVRTTTVYGASVGNP
jgi:hypothetical protein